MNNTVTNTETNQEEGYGLNWVGKKDSYHSAYTPTDKILKPLKEDSKNFDDTGNILIKGDNLDALKLLKKNYFEKVKMIYIDPPYNTGNNFVYKDNFTQDQKTVLEQLGYNKKQKDYIKNIAGAKKHSGWLSFMYPRLLLAKDLLKDDGVIFISIDDGESSNLRKVCDEIFGESNFMACITWRRKKESANDSKGFSVKGEYILVYSKSTNFQINPLPLSEEYLNDSYYEPTNEFPLGKWRPIPIATTKGHQGGGYQYDVVTPSGRVISNKTWLYSERSFNQLKKEGRLYFGKSGDGLPQRVAYDFESKGTPPSNIWLDQGTNKEGKNEYFSLLEISAKEKPKPTRLIMEMLKICSFDENDIVLDFFAGSGTTGHATMQLNAEDGGNRKYILVQLPEPIDPKKQKEAYNFVTKELGKEPTIFEITAERLRRAGDKIVKDNAQSKKPKDLSHLDIGFKAYEIAEDLTVQRKRGDNHENN